MSSGIRKEEIIMGSQAGDPKSREEQTTTTVYHANSTGRVEIQIGYFKKSRMWAKIEITIGEELD